MNFSLFNNTFRRLLGSLWLVLLPLLGWGQSTIFNETFGTPSGSPSISSYANGTAPATFSTKGNGYTYSAGGAASGSDIRATSASSGYTGATGSGNTFFSSSTGEYGFAIAGINASSYSGLSLSFGLRKEAASAYTLVVDYSIDNGTSYTPLTVSGLPSSTAATGWYGITGVAVPAAAQVNNLVLRFRKTGSTGLRVDDIILTGTAAAGTPLLSTTGTLTAFSTPVGTPSAAQSYTLTGSSLAADVTVAAPTGYEVSQTSATAGFAATQTVAQSGGSAAATIYVRLTGTTAGTFSGSVTNTSTTASASVAVTGNTTGLTVTPTSLSNFSTSQGTASAYQTYALTGGGLSSSVTVTAPTGYEVAQGVGTSTINPGTFTASLTVTQANAANGRTIYVRLAAATPAGTYTDAVTNAATGAPTQSVAVSGTVTPPTLAVTPTSLGGFSTTQGTASAYQTYALTGSGLSGGVTVTAPAGYEVAQGVGTSTTNPGTFTASLTVSQANATTGRTIYVRLAAATAAGSYTGSVTNAATGAATQSVALSGTVAAPAPTLAASVASLAAFNAPAGTPSASQTYTLTGANLTSDITVTAPTGFEVSLTGAAGSYASTATAPAASVQASGGQAIFVHLLSATDGTYGGNVVNAGGGATSQNVAVSGTVVAFPAAAPAPTVAAGSLTISSAVLTLGAGAGTNLLVVVRPSTAAATAPTSGTAYTGAAAYGTGTALGAGFVVFAAANASSVTVTGLAPTSSYVADVYTYNVGTATGGEAYGPASGTSGAFTTLTPPPSAAGTLLLEEDFDYASGTVLTQTAGTGWLRQGSSSAIPVATASGNQARDTYPQGANFATVKPSGFTESTQARLSGASGAEDIYKPFAAAPAGGSTLYAAALINLSAVAGSDYFFSFSNSSTTFVGRVFAQPTTGGYQLGLSTNTSTGTYTGAPVMSFNTTYLMVLKVDNSSGNDVTSLFIFDNSATTALPVTEPATPSVGPVSSSSTALAGLSAVLLRQSSGTYPTLTLDNLRVASGWGAAIGQPVFTTSTGTLGAGSYYSVRVSGTAARATTTGPAAIEKLLDLDGGTIATTAANPLVLRYRTPTTPPDDFQILIAAGGTSYVDGPLAREVAAGAGPSQLFAIGRSGNYRPLTLNIDIAPNAATLYTASQTEGQPADQTLNAPLARISQVRYYTLTPSPVPAAGTFSGSVELSFGSDDGVTDPSAADFVVAKNSNDGSHWTSISRQSNTSAMLKSGSFQSFSDFALGNTDATLAANPLPVQLTSLTAARGASGVQVAWATASEVNSAKFVVERSLDGYTYLPVASVAAQGSTQQAHRYTSLDRTAPAGQLYYRLRQVDVDGTAHYSPTVTVAGATAEFALTPNPARESLHLLTEQPTPYLVRTALGQVALQGTTAAGTTTIAVEQLAAGVYFFELHASTGRVVRRFVKE